MVNHKDWILQNKEIKRNLNAATWIPLRAIQKSETGDIQNIGFKSEFFGCGSVAFPPENITQADTLGWDEIGIRRETLPYAYEDGYYSSTEQYQYDDKKPIGIHLVFEYIQPVLGIRKWMLSPDLIIALGLVQEGSSWVRPEENFVEVAREIIDEYGNYELIEIKREFLMDYLAARNLSLRLSYYRQRVENVDALETSPYAGLVNVQELRNEGKYELLIRTLSDVYGGVWTAMRVWRTDVDGDEDAPVMGSENNENTDYEQTYGQKNEFKGIRVEGEFWKNEWVQHQGNSVRVRKDLNHSLPNFIVDTDGSRMTSTSLCNEEIGRWLWFRSSIVNELVGLRGFSLGWCTAETGAIQSTSGYDTHFGVNVADFITVYAFDIARLPAWEQHIWAAHNVVPEGKVSQELLMSQVQVMPAATKSAETKLFEYTKLLEINFEKKYGVKLFSRDVDLVSFFKNISRFSSRDLPSLLRLAKEVIQFFSERLNKVSLRLISTHKEKSKLGSNKLFESILADEVGSDKAREIFGIIAGTYEMRNGDAHQIGSSIGDALKLAKINAQATYLKQGEQLIDNFACAIWCIGMSLFTKPESE